MGRGASDSGEAGSHTLFWTHDYCRSLQRAGDVGKALRVLFGGAHRSQPSLTSFGVRPGSRVYPIRLEKGRLFIVAGMRVERFISVADYIVDVLGLSDAYAKLPVYQLEERLKAERPEWGHRLPWGCLVEVAIGDGSRIRLDRAVPPEVAEAIRFVSRRGERPIKQLDAGVITSSVGLQGGVYRLSDASAIEFARLVAEVP